MLQRMPLVNHLVPSRFLTITAHLVIVITIFWSRENNVQASLPLQCTQKEYESRDTEMVIALSITLGLLALELAGFLSGVSMFNDVQSLLSIGAHGSAAVTLLFFLFEQWDGRLYWWIFAFCRSVVVLVAPSEGRTGKRQGGLFPQPHLQGAERRSQGCSGWQSAAFASDGNKESKLSSKRKRIPHLDFPDCTPPALAAHCSASICLSFFTFERWETSTYWYIMGFCSALPTAVEILLFISVFGLKRKPF